MSKMRLVPSPHGRRTPVSECASQCLLAIERVASAQLDLELRGSFCSELLLQRVDLLVGERAFHRAVGDPVAVRRLALFRILKRIDQVDLLDQLARHRAPDLVKVVGLKPVREPKRNILVARRVLGVGLESGHLARLELLEEALVVGPEEADVRDGEENHRETLEAEAKGPAVAVGLAALCEHFRMHDAAAENLHPISVVENLELEGRFGEREVLVDPPLLNLAKEVVAQTLERLLQVVRHQLAAVAREPLLARHRAAHKLRVEELDALHLVEGRKVGSIDLVSPVDVARAEKCLDALADQRRLVRRRVRAQESILGRRDILATFAGDVVRVGGQAARMVFRNEKVVEAFLGVDDRLHAVADLELD
mmetsp:Transcript_27285/g.59915  ORF Transcript_27285/g.59915 Transcript_27285/m.59915 type:complete len:366 (+) Transcript_27285:282-1379(+)